MSDEDVVEISYRYIKVYESLTGNKFQFPSANIKQELLEKLKTAGYITGSIVIIMAGSDSDMPHIEKIKNELDKYQIKSIIRICSAHKQPARCEQIINKYNGSLEPAVIIAVAGGTDALSGVASFHSIHPVISCPPNPENYHSCIHNPPGSSNSLIIRPANAARHSAQILGKKDIILKYNKEKIKKLEKADGDYNGL